MRLLQLKPRHTITRLALSPDGTRVAVGQPGHGVRVVEAVSGADVLPLVEYASRTDFLRLNSPTGRHALTVGRPDAVFVEVATGATPLHFQRGWRRGLNRNHPPDEAADLPLDGSVSVTTAATTRYPVAWFQLSPCAVSGDHRFVVGRSPSHRERVILYDLTSEAVVGQFPNARGFGIPFRATFAAGQLVIADTQCVSVYDLAAATPAPPADEAPGAAAAPDPDRGPIGRFVQALFRTGPRGKGRSPAALAPRPVPMLEPWATVVPTTPQPDTEIPPFALLPCGRRMIVRGEKSRVELRDVPTGEVLTVWKWGLPRVRALAVSANGLLAAAAGAKGQLMLWDLE